MNLNNEYEILTETGWQDFRGVVDMGPKKTVTLTFTDGTQLVCTPDHEIYLQDGSKKEAKFLTTSDQIQYANGVTQIASLHANGIERVFDVVGVSNGNRFYGNGILVSNCEFITFEETLISSVTIMKAESVDPIRTSDNVRWYSEINPDATYIVGLDPAMGTGGDSAAIQVFEMPSLKQVAEWRHNRTIIEKQVSILRDVLRELESSGVSEIYWSVENNAVGEAALVVIRDTGEESFPGNMLHDPRAKGGSKRKGFTTTNKSKLEACSKLKSLYESGRMKIYSKALISELATYVSRGVSYEARSGSTDDLISATLLCIRMMEFVAQWDEDSHNVMSSNIGGSDEDEEDYESPMPIAFI